MRLLLVLLLLLGGVSEPAGEGCVFYITTDGLRWQEVFAGADASLAGKDKEFWRDTAEARRETLMPFLWGEIAKKGQIYGNRYRGAVAQVTNGRNFSYPGYQELLAGFPDPKIDSNDRVPNPNATVLEWLNKRPGFEGRVAAFGCWDRLPYIINRERSGVPILACWEPIVEKDLNERERAHNDLLRDTPRVWEDCAFDVFCHTAAVEYIKRRKPRVVYIMYGETDEWAHAGDYPKYLRAANRVDRFLRELWDLAQSMPEYKGKTSIVFSTDHGRGEEREWRNHSSDTAGAQDLWMALLGPKVAASGDRADVPPVRQSQLAATVAALAGEDYAVAKAARPLPFDGSVPKRDRPSTKGSEREWRFEGALPKDVARVEGKPEFEKDHVALDGKSYFVVAEEGIRAGGEFSVSARVAVVARQDWGGLVGCLQDNGPAESGWILGFDKERFYFGLASKGPGDSDGMITYLRGAKYELAKWHHVVATYDGESMILYVDGKEVARSMAQWGDVLTPSQKTPFVIGAYVDADESHPIEANLRAVRFATRAWTAEEIAKASRE